jgi:hypothetical protein
VARIVSKVFTMIQTPFSPVMALSAHVHMTVAAFNESPTDVRCAGDRAS